LKRDPLGSTHHATVSVMSEQLTWALRGARQHTLALVADVPPEHMRLQSVPGERHPAWILGHLLLSDMYLLSLLGVQQLTRDFQVLLGKYGPKAPPAQQEYDSKDQLTQRLAQSNLLRLGRVQEMTDTDLARPMTDSLLAPVQPTIGHHLHSMVFHEGYHSGQLSSWRKTHGRAPVRWVFGPKL
jgi:uncharacterized damage-inducible protein DinB